MPRLWDESSSWSRRLLIKIFYPKGDILPLCLTPSLIWQASDISSCQLTEAWLVLYYFMRISQRSFGIPRSASFLKEVTLSKTIK